MSKQNGKNVHDVKLTFENVWVYSQDTASRYTHDHDTNIDTKTSRPPSIYQKWSDKFRKFVAADPISITHKRVLINGVTGQLLAGQVTVLTGSSGSGKSVLLRVLAGLLPISRGDIYLNNDDISSINAYQSIHDTVPTQWRTQIALLAQHPQLLEGRVIDNLKIPYSLQAHQQRRFDIDWHIAQLEHMQRNADFLYQDTTYLSGGERQLVNTLRLLQLSPQVLLLDEPTAALDVDTSAQLVQLLMSWLRLDRRRTLLWVTHDTQDIMPLANHHWHMQAGILSQVF
ncbi:MAG: ABC transporter ATP-binding protein [Psychrobacter sp.]|uniref:ABC transporter ATP-binding protein n=1 Tax=unclassified Psychrobacter TaxID=196806 RepID=UPI0017879289|nr:MULTISPECIES: ATP-binding cassette domain-containing protein [unclassified Psychrobacter]MBE0443168.1 ATP-binding cassette domain-containing protein [Psychrobacter sp. FME13]